MVGKKSWGRINWSIYTEDQDKGQCLLWTLNGTDNNKNWILPISKAGKNHVCYLIHKV
jgi:hypothetical protein